MQKKPLAEWVEKTGTVCLFDWSAAYLDYAKIKFSEKTYKEKKAMFKLFLKQVGPDLPVENLTSKMVLDYILDQREHRSGYSVNKDRKNLVAAWNWGKEYMDPPLPDRNPCRVDKMPEIRKPRYVPPEEDFLKVYEVAEGQDKVMLLAFLHLAARRGEIFRLTWNDIDFVNNRVRLATRKRMGGTFEYDVLPMTKELRTALRWWWEHRPIQQSPYVFVCLDKNQKGRENYGQRFTHRHSFMKSMCKAAKVPRFGFHAIRHLSASRLFNLGYDVAVIQMILRHQSPSTTENYLKSLGLEKAREALESLSLEKGKVLSFPSDEKQVQKSG